MTAAPDRPVLDDDEDPESNVGPEADEDYRPKTVDD